MTPNNDADYNTTTVLSNTRRLAQLAESTPVQQFATVAQNQMPDVNPDELNHPGPRGFRTATDQAMSQFSTPVNVTTIDATIRSFIVKMPTGPVRTRPVDRIGNHRSTVPLSNGRNTGTTDYTLEKDDPNHRMADVIELFLPLAPANPGLYEWLSSLSYDEVCRLMRSRGKDDRYILRYASPFMHGIKYLDAASRISYRVDFQNGVLHWANSLLDTTTQNLQTVFSGIGWGIWVLSPSGDFYTGSHKLGEFHHSSFLSGEPVKAAGEWQVTNGQIDYITGKTGHYRCDVNALLLALRQLAGMKALHADTKVIIWENDVALPVAATAFMKDVALQDRCRAAGPKPPGLTAKNAADQQQYSSTPNRLRTGLRIGGHRGPSQQMLPNTGNGAHQQNTHRNFYQSKDYNNQTD